MIRGELVTIPGDGADLPVAGAFGLGLALLSGAPAAFPLLVSVQDEQNRRTEFRARSGVYYQHARPLRSARVTPANGQGCVAVLDLGQEPHDFVNETAPPAEPRRQLEHVSVPERGPGVVATFAVPDWATGWVLETRAQVGGPVPGHEVTTWDPGGMVLTLCTAGPAFGIGVVSCLPSYYGNPAPFAGGSALASAVVPPRSVVQLRWTGAVETVFPAWDLWFTVVR